MNSIAHLLTQTVTYAARNGKGNDGDPTFATKAEISARVETKSKLTSNQGGQFWAQYTVIVSLVEIPMGSKVWLPGADTTKDNEALQVLSTKSANAISDTSTLYEAYV